MKAFEEPLVSNGLHLGRGKQHPLQSTSVKSMWEGWTLGELTLWVKLSLRTQQKETSWVKTAAFCVTTITIRDEPSWFVSFQQLSKKREAVVSPLKLTEHPTWCPQMADGRKKASISAPCPSVGLGATANPLGTPPPPPPLSRTRQTTAFTGWC